MLVETLNHASCKIEIHTDDDPMSPRDWDNLGTMVCFHRRYSLGDDHSYSEPREFLEDIGEQAVILPLYLYDHSGITISTGPFVCPWDSGQIGWIYVTYATLRKEYGWKHITAKRRQQIEDYLRAEVKTYDQFLTGDVYGYVVKRGEDDEDSCWGFFGLSYCIEAAKDVAEYIERRALPLLDSANLIHL